MDWREENKLKQKAQEYYEKEFSYNQVYIQGYSDGYNKAIDEFAEKIKKIIEKDLANPDLMLDCKKCGIWKAKDIDEIIEQMKAGGKNE